MKPRAAGPGLAKTRSSPLFQSRTLRLVASSDARWGELFEKADIVSEGAPRGEGAERVYFGSSNILLLVRPERPGDTLEGFAKAIARDPHVRLRALRTARREAAQRAHGPIDSLRAEIKVFPSQTGVTVHVDVEARVLPDRRVVPRDAGIAPETSETLAALAPSPSKVIS